MGMIRQLVDILFGSDRNVLRETVEIFRENAESGAGRDHAARSAALAQLGQEFAPRNCGRFDRFMDGVNRLPRPAMALGTLALVAAALVDPVWFAARMQGMALIPDPLWWVFGAIVSFYFGARQQAKTQEFQRDLAASLGRVPMVVRNLEALRDLDPQSPRSADPKDDLDLQLSLAKSDGNPALLQWQKTRETQP